MHINYELLAKPTIIIPRNFPIDNPDKSETNRIRSLSSVLSDPQDL